MGRIDEIIAKQKELAEELELAKQQWSLALSIAVLLFLVLRLKRAYLPSLASHIRICQYSPRL